MEAFLREVCKQLMPFPLALMLLAAACVLLWLGWQRSGRWLATFSLLVLVVSGIDGTVYRLLRPLEEPYRPVQIQGPVSYVVIMGAAFDDHSKIPLSNRGTPQATYRFLEGLIQYRAHPGSKLIVSGRGSYRHGSFAEFLAQLAEQVGVPKEDILVQTESMNTEEEVADLKPMVGDRPFIVVTSAVHMPRTLELFAKAGLHPQPVMTDYMGQRDDDWLDRPSLDNVRRTEFALHEYIGLAWQRLKALFG